MFLFCLTLPMVAQGSFMSESMSDDPIIIPIGAGSPGPDGHPRTGLSFYSAIDTDMSLFLISVASDCGDVSLVLENQITGEYYSTSFDYYHPLSIPLMSVSGWWTVTLTLESGIIYYGEVEI